MKTLKRRDWLRIFAFVGVFGGILGQAAYAFVKSFLPKVHYEPPKRFKVGPAYQFSEGPNFIAKYRIFIVREENKFHALSSVCTHLGCNVSFIKLSEPRKVKVRGKEIEEKWEFHCACHGSKFLADGTPYSGPAPSPLSAYGISISSLDQQLIVNKGQEVDSDNRLTIQV